MSEPALRPGRPGGKRDANRKRRRSQIAEAALGLFVEAGVELTSIDQIVAAAGVAKGSFYRYYADKEALVEALFEPIGAAVVGAMDRCLTAVSASRHMAEFFAAYQTLSAELNPHLLGQPALVRLYLQESRAPAVGARRPIRALADLIAERAIDLNQAARGANLFRDDVPAAVSALTVVGAVERIATAYLDAPELLEVSPVEAGRALISLLLDGLVRRGKPGLF